MSIPNVNPENPSADILRAMEVEDNVNDRIDDSMEDYDNEDGMDEHYNQVNKMYITEGTRLGYT